MTPRPSRPYPGIFGLGAVLALGAVSLPQSATGCVGDKLSPGAASALDATFATLCPLEALANAAAGAACPGEDLAFNAVVGADTASTPPVADAGAPGGSAPLVALFRRGAAGEPPLVHIGSVSSSTPPAKLASLRRRALAIVGPVAADGGAK